MKCPDCNGTGRMTCRYCEGVGSTIELNAAYIPIFRFAMPQAKICDYCSGSGEKICSCCGGTGKIPDQK